MRPKKNYPAPVDPAAALDRYSPVPLYQQLAERLSELIQSGELKPGDPLPSEYDLMHRYSISRYVVRQTLANLLRQGLIFTEQGRGSFVSFHRVDKSLSMLQSYHQNMREAGLPVEVAILEQSLTYPGPEAAAFLRLPPGGLAFHLERVGSHQGAPLNLLVSDITLPPEKLALLTKFSGGSLYAYLEQVCHVTLHHAHSYLEVTFAGETESRRLKQPRGSVLLQIISQVTDAQGAPLEFTRIVYPATMFRFSFESQAAALLQPPPDSPFAHA